jgi:hypothetical protein
MRRLTFTIEVAFSGVRRGWQIHGKLSKPAAAFHEDSLWLIVT